MIHKAKKSLGQNFLKSEMALKKIIEAGEIKPTDVILEIGPGKGVLTEKLLVKAKLVIAVEKDRELFEFLKNKFEKEIKSGSLVLVLGDILDFEINNYKLKKYKIVANIPYNITGAILKKFLTAKNPSGVALRASQPERIVLMVQREVAKRILARDGKESILSISVKAYGKPKFIMKVPARYFSPAPKVDSVIISINNISHQFFIKNKISEEKFWKIVKAGFAHKRKKLAGNLKPFLTQKASLIFTKAKIKESSRAEDINLNQWLMIATILLKNPLST